MALPYVEVETGSWSHELEDRIWLSSSAFRIPYAAIPAIKLPDEIRRDEWLKIENQASQGSCQGNALASGIECCWTEHGGRPVQLSRQAGYILSQRRDKISGDRGSTIAGGCYVAEHVGLCLESVWPYPSRYDSRIPAAFEDSVKWKAAGHSPIGNYEHTLKHLVNGSGHIGVMWGSATDRAVANGDGVMESWASGGGGHAVEAVGYSRMDFQGNPLRGDDPYVVWVNSWSERWGARGRFMTSPRATQQMIDSRWTVFEGLFGLITPDVEWTDYEPLE